MIYLISLSIIVFFVLSIVFFVTSATPLGVTFLIAAILTLILSFVFDSIVVKSKNNNTFFSNKFLQLLCKPIFVFCIEAVFMGSAFGIYYGCFTEEKIVDREIKRIMSDSSLSNREKIDKLFRLNIQHSEKHTSTSPTYTSDQIWHNMTTGDNEHGNKTTSSSTYPYEAKISEYANQLVEYAPEPDEIFIKQASDTKIQVGAKIIYEGFYDVYTKAIPLGKPSWEYCVNISKNGELIRNSFSQSKNYTHKEQNNLDDFYSTFVLPNNFEKLDFEIIFHPLTYRVNNMSYFKDTYYTYKKEISTSEIFGSNKIVLTKPSVTDSKPNNFKEVYLN